MKPKKTQNIILALLLLSHIASLCAQQYCNLRANNSGYMWISKVELGDISRISDGDNYVHELSQTTNLPCGNNYNLLIETEGNYALSIFVWIDFDNDGLFTTDERVASDLNQNNTVNTSSNFNIYIPAHESVLGQRRMRIVGIYSYYMNTTNNDGSWEVAIQENTGSNIEGCSRSTSSDFIYHGDVEDYTINIVSESLTDVTYTYDQAGNRNSRTSLSVEAISISDTETMASIREYTQNTDDDISIPYSDLSNFNLYPNPVHSKLIIEGSVNQDLDMMIHNLNGELIYTGSHLDNTEVDFSVYQVGMYFITLTSADGAYQQSWRIIKAN